MITVPLSRLTLRHHEVGRHRGRRWGLREVFGFPTLRDLPFMHLASRVRRAYEGKEVPSHEGWPAQREALQWLVDRGRDGIYALEDEPLTITRTPFQTYYLLNGNHRALALYVLSESSVRAHLRQREQATRG